MANQLERSNHGSSGFWKWLTTSSTDRVNEANRGVVDYNSCDIGALFDPLDGVHNSVVSGGTSQIRNNAIIAQAECALKNEMPVIVIHEGNKSLEQQMRNIFHSSGKFQEISEWNPCFEPFYGLNEFEISNQILETAPKEYDIKYNARYYIDGVSDFLKVSGKVRSFKLFSTCPHATLFDKVDDLEVQGIITSSKAQDIKSKLMTGQTENFKLDTFFTSLKSEMYPVMYGQRNGVRPSNVYTCLKAGNVICLDLLSVTNKLLVNTVFYQLKLALTKGIRYQVIIDSIPVEANELYSTFLRAPSDKVSKVIASDDFYSMVGGDDRLFSSVLGNTHTLVVMRHQSGHSAAKWAEIFGQYDKFEKSYSNSKGSSRRTPWSIVPSPNDNKTVNISKTREYIVKPETIARLRDGEAYILSANSRQLAHLSFTK